MNGLKDYGEQSPHSDCKYIEDNLRRYLTSYKEALSWIEDQEPELVYSAKVKFGLEYD